MGTTNEAPLHPPEYMTLAELAAYSSMSKSTLRKWLRIGMPHYRLGRSIRIKRNEFDQWLEQFRAAGTRVNDFETLWQETLREVQHEISNN